MEAIPDEAAEEPSDARQKRIVPAAAALVAAAARRRLGDRSSNGCRRASRLGRPS
jgi:hypothetical protein